MQLYNISVAANMAEPYTRLSMEGCPVGGMRALFRAVELEAILLNAGHPILILIKIHMLELGALLRQQ